MKILLKIGVSLRKLNDGGHSNDLNITLLTKKIVSLLSLSVASFGVALGLSRTLLTSLKQGWTTTQMRPLTVL